MADQCVDIGLRRGVRDGSEPAMGLDPLDDGGGRQRAPAHIVIRAVDRSVRSSSCNAVVINRLPVLPTGCPSAIAPPLTLTLSSISASGIGAVYLRPAQDH